MGTGEVGEASRGGRRGKQREGYCLSVQVFPILSTTLPSGVSCCQGLPAGDRDLCRQDFVVVYGDLY